MKTQLRALLAVAVIATAVGACHGSYHPSEVADRCRCGLREYCDIKPASSSTDSQTACLPIPAKCPDPPTCSCLGTERDACREDLGRFYVFERRDVEDCDDCSPEEYCWTYPKRPVGGPAHQCQLLPPQCEDQSTCECMGRARHTHDVCAECDGRKGRIEMTAWDICPTTHVDTQGWLVVDCPGHPDACVKLVEQRCGGPYVLAGANADGGAPRALIRSPAGTKYARQAAGEGYLRARCVTKLIEEHL